MKNILVLILYQDDPISEYRRLLSLLLFKINIQGDVAGFEKNGVRFEDGTFVEVDTIILATGYTFNFPYLEPQKLLPVEVTSWVLVDTVADIPSCRTTKSRFTSTFSHRISKA